MSDDVIEKIKSEINSDTMVLFMKGVPEAPQCGFSAATVQILNGYKKPYKAVNVLANPDIRQHLPEVSNWPTFPQLFIKGKLVGGCDIVHELRDNGELDKLIAEAFDR